MNGDHPLAHTTGANACQRVAVAAGRALASAWRRFLDRPESVPRESARECAESALADLAERELLFNALAKQGTYNPCSSEDWLAALQIAFPSFLEADLRSHFYTYLLNEHLFEDYDKSSELLIALCEECNSLIEAGPLYTRQSSDDNEPKRSPKPRRKSEFDVESDLLAALEPLLKRSLSSQNTVVRDSRTVLTGFVVLANSVGYITKPVWSTPKSIVFNTSFFDFEYLRSVLFGLWSSMRGFDDLFGGGGPYLFRRGSGQAGRLFVIEGGVGLGKSTLGLSLAADVVRKGGFAWMIPFEQSCSECHGYLRDHRMLPENYGVNVQEGARGYQALKAAGFPAASLLMCRGAQDTFKEVFEEIVEVDEAVALNTVRLVVIDPLNAITEASGNTPLSRDELLTFIDNVRRRGINIVVTAEAQNGPSDERVEIFQKLADVVIRLSRLESSLVYTHRFIEVVKSRKQREQRGQHPYSIRSGTGIHVYPSSAAVAARLRNRRVRVADEASQFGWRPLDVVLGDDALLRGDVIVFRGVPGTLKTELAVVFALGYEKHANKASERSCSLFVPLKDDPQVIRRVLDRKTPRLVRADPGTSGLRDAQQVVVLGLPTGYIHPGVFFSRLEAALKSLRNRGKLVERLVFDNAEHWDIDCPFIAADPTFAATLVDFARRRGITTVFVCHAPSDESSAGRVEQSLISAADVTLKFWRYGYGGKENIAFRVVATRSMKHDPDQYSLLIRDNQLEIGVKAKQFRFEGNSATPVPIKLFLHSEGSIHDSYNASIETSLRLVLSRTVESDPSDRSQLVKWLGLTSFSTVDEVQILQLDEFQLPQVANPRFPVPPPELSELRFPRASEAEINSLLSELDPSLLDRCRISTTPPLSPDRQPARLFALPYYQNVGVLTLNTLHPNALNKNGLTWTAINERAEAWEVDHPDDKDQALFLDFGCDKNETYISFFFEMALGMGVKKPSPKTLLGHWFLENENALLEVLRSYVILTYRAHRKHPGRRPTYSRHKTLVNQKSFRTWPVLWRHWFTTAAEMFAGLSTEDWSSLAVILLPGQVSVAGEWYLTIPSYSAAPEFGAQVVRQLIDKEDEFERLRRGVGLPIRAAMYDPEQTGSSELRCRYFSLPSKETGETLRGALRRSQIADYASVSQVLSFQLKRILEIHNIWKPDSLGRPNETLKEYFASMVKSLNAASPERPYP